jgi:NAD(P)-dependent dehydrogenase (short-subunit alcohol dehydrogenase family)
MQVTTANAIFKMMGSKKMKVSKSLLIVGASRGLGLALAHEFLKRGWNVVGTVRAEKTKLHDLLPEFNGKLRIETVDTTIPEQVEKLKARLTGTSFDLLFVNAGVANKNGMSEPIGETSTEEFIRVMVANALSPMKVLEAFSDAVRFGGAMGVMSSGQGSIADNETGGNDVYRASKAALNMLMRSFAARQEKDRTLLLLAPGWVKTDLGGSDARFTVEEVTPQVVDTILAQEGKTGLHYLDRFGKTVRW